MKIGRIYLPDRTGVSGGSGGEGKGVALLGRIGCTVRLVEK